MIKAPEAGLFGFCRAARISAPPAGLAPRAGLCYNVGINPKGELHMIRPATAADLDAICAVYAEIFEKERSGERYTQWIEGVYPTRETAERGVGAGTMYVLEEGGRADASMILNSFQPAEYYEMPWLYPAADEDVLVIHTLCVSPKASGRGLGTRMVDFASGFALGRGMKVIRLDTNVKNTPAQSFYLRHGFRLAGSHHSLHEGVLDTELVYMERSLA